MFSNIVARLRTPRNQLVCVLVFLIAGTALPAQTTTPPAAAAQVTSPAATPQLTFDVISVRQNKSGSSAMTRQSSADSDGITMTNVPLILVVFYAFHINDENLATGLPDWTMAERYDVSAKVAPSDVPAYQKLTSTQRGQMMQPVLAERFNLKAHRETREKPVYALTIAKGGILGMKPATPGDTYPKGIHPAAGGFVHGSTIFNTGPSQFTAQAASMADLALLLSNSRQHSLGRVVVDRTGLTGKYDFTLQLPPESDARSDSDEQQPDSSAGSSVFSALQEQLGLKLQPATAPTEYLVVDHIERPSDN